jgi:methanogenic corrinoid protein MtbC1
MMNFDQPLFFNTYNALLAEKSFRDVFYEVFIPLMQEIGLLWQTNTITPAHEHFISYLLRQKILTTTERIQILEHTKGDKTFVLFLPKGELHDIGLMYIHYEVTLHGYRSIYLGESVPLESLIDLKSQFSNIIFVSYLTIEPVVDELKPYLSRFSSEILEAGSQLWVLGNRAREMNYPLPQGVKSFSDIPSLIKEL